MYYHGEDTKVETNSGTSMSWYQDFGTHTKVLANEHTNIQTSYTCRLETFIILPLE
jgi:hypothetical protein